MSFSKKMQETFLWLDILGRNFSFVQGGLQSYKTHFGGLLTIAIFSTVFVISYLFGKEIYEKASPNVVTTDDLLAESNINMNSLPIILSFHNNYGDNYNNIERLVDFELFYFGVNADYSIDIRTYDYLVDCSSNFTRYNDFASLILDGNAKFGIKSFCLNLNGNDLLVRNDFSIPDSSFIGLRISYCDPKKRITCDPKVLDLTTEIQARLTFINSYVDSKNYANPVSFYQDSLTQQIGNLYSKQTFLRFTNNVVLTEDGWILENQVPYDYVSLRSIKQDVNPGVKNLMFSIIIESPRLRIATKRNYLKIQELAAKIGGFYNAISICITLLVNNYIKFRYSRFIAEECFKGSSAQPSQSLFKNDSSVQHNFINNEAPKNLIVGKKQAQESSATKPNCAEILVIDHFNKKAASQEEPLHKENLNQSYITYLRFKLTFWKKTSSYFETMLSKSNALMSIQNYVRLFDSQLKVISLNDGY